MSERFSTSIEFGGRLVASKVQELNDAINSEDLSLEWGEASVNLKSQEDLLECVDGKTGTIILKDIERSWDIELEGLEETLKELNLTYMTRIDGHSGYDSEMKFWSPKKGLVELVTDSSGHPIATQEELKEILKLLNDNPPFTELARKKLQKLTQKFIVPPFKIVGD